MTETEVHQLIECAKQGDQFAFTDLYNLTTNLAKQWSRQIANLKGAVYHDEDDMHIAAMECLPGIVRCYSPEKGKWQTYFRRCYINAIKTQSKRITEKWYSKSSKRAGVLPASWLIDQAQKHATLIDNDKLLEAGSIEECRGSETSHLKTDHSNKTHVKIEELFDNRGVLHPSFSEIALEALEKVGETDQEGLTAFKTRHSLDLIKPRKRTYKEVAKRMNISESYAYKIYQRFIKAVKEMITKIDDDPDRLDQEP